MNMREEFELWFFGEKGIIGLYADNGRYLPDAKLAWRAWQSSRASVVIELPEPATPERFGVTQANDPEQYEVLEARHGAQYAAISQCRRAIEAVGLKVKA